MNMSNLTCPRFKEYLSKKIDEWQLILNLNYETDAGSSIIEYAKGQLNAYVEVLEFINQQEKLDEQGRVAEETRGFDKEAGEDGKNPLSKIQHE